MNADLGRAWAILVSVLVRRRFQVACAIFAAFMVWANTRPQPMCQLPRLPRPTVVSDLVALASAIDEFTAHHDGREPSSLDDLVAPDADGRTYLNVTHVPLDPWGRRYIYGPGDPFNVRCLGRDGVVGGEGDDEDFDYLTIASGSWRDER